MYPSAFCQPSYRQSCGTETWVRRSRAAPERSYVSQPFVTYQPSSAQYHQHSQPSNTLPTSPERTHYLQLLHNQSLARAHRRTLLARREAERQAQRQRQQQAALREYYLAEREARALVDREARVLASKRAQEERRHRMRDERAEFVELIDGLFNGITRSSVESGYSRAEEEEERTRARRFSDSESDANEEEEDVAMRGLLDSFLHGFGLQDPSAISQDTNVPKPSDDDQTVEHAPTGSPDSDAQETSNPLQAIHQAYAANKARVARLETLDALHRNLVDLVAGFTFPPSLDFTTSAASTSALPDSSMPELTFTSRNTPFHAHAQSLLGLLVEADAVLSDGDEEVRARRKEFVGLVEAELDALEVGKRRIWQEQRDQD